MYKRSLKGLKDLIYEKEIEVAILMFNKKIDKNNEINKSLVIFKRKDICIEVINDLRERVK